MVSRANKARQTLQGEYLAQMLVVFAQSLNWKDTSQFVNYFMQINAQLILATSIGYAFVMPSANILTAIFNQNGGSKNDKPKKYYI